MQIDLLYNKYQANIKNVTATAASGANAVVTIEASENEFWGVVGVIVSYATAPTNGLLTISIGGTVVFETHIVGAGHHQIDLKNPIYNGVKNQPIVVTLADGTAAKKLNVQYL